MKLNFQTPGYAAAKRAVDAVVRPEDFENFSAAPGFPVTTFDIARIAMALYLARNLKIEITEKVVKNRFDAEALQAFLDYYANRPTSWGHYSAAVGLKQLSRSYFHTTGAGRFTAPRMPEIFYDNLRDELTDQPLVGRPEAIVAFAEHLKIAKSTLRTVGLSPDLIDVNAIVARAERTRGWLGSSDSIKSAFALPVSGIAFSFSMDPYEGSKAGEQVALMLANVLLHERQIELVHDRLTEIAERHDAALAPTLTIQWTESYLETGAIYVSAHINDLNENLEDHRRFEPLGSLTIKNVSDAEILEALENPKRFNDLLGKFDMALRQTAKRRKRRMAIREQTGQGIVLVDPITEHLLTLIEEKQSGFTEKALRGNAAKSSIKLAMLASVSAGRPVKGNPERISTTIPVSFRLKEARLRSRIPLNADTEWVHDRIITKPLPDAVLQSLIGKTAQDVVAHPFTKHLGSVVRARTIQGGKSEIQFEIPERAITAPSPRS